MRTNSNAIIEKTAGRRWALLMVLLLVGVLCTTLFTTTYARADEDDPTAAEEVAAEATADEATDAEATDDEKADEKATDAAADKAAAEKAAAEKAAADKAKAEAADAAKTTGADEDAAKSVEATNLPEDATTMGNDVLASGDKITFSGSGIPNDIITVGETINVSGSQVNGSIRAAGRVLTVSDAQVAESITMAGQNLNITGGSSKVVALAGQNLTFRSETGELYLAGHTVLIDGVINGDVHVVASKLEIGDNAQITGTLSGTIGNDPTIAAGASIGSNELKVEKKEKTDDPKSLFDWRIIAASVASCLLISLLCEWLAGGQTAGAAALFKERPGSFLLSAILGAILVPLFVVLLCLPVVTIPAAVAILLASSALGMISGGLTAAILGRLLLPRVGRFITAALMGVLLGAAMAMPYVGAPLRGIASLFALGYVVCSIRKGMSERRAARDEGVVQI